MGVTHPRNVNPGASALRPIQRDTGLQEDRRAARELAEAAAVSRKRQYPQAPENKRVSVPTLEGTKAKGGLGGASINPQSNTNVR